MDAVQKLDNVNMNAGQELDKTLNYWFFDYDIFDSLSNSSGKIIRVKKIFKR